MVDILDTTDKGGPFLACYIMRFDPAHFDKLTRLTNYDDLGKVGPSHPSCLTLGQAWGTTPLNQVFGIGNNKEDKVNTSVNALTTRL